MVMVLCVSRCKMDFVQDGVVSKSELSTQFIKLQTQKHLCLSLKTFIDILYSLQRRYRHLVHRIRLDDPPTNRIARSNTLP